MQTSRKSQIAVDSSAPQAGVLRPQVGLATGQEASHASPALRYQRQLDEALRRASVRRRKGRWPVRATLLFSGGISAALWAAIIAAVYALIH